MSRVKVDEEEYWNSSKFKAFTFDDEDDDLFQLKESKRAVNSLREIVDDDDDDLEKYSWSGEPVGSISWSIKETSSNSRAAAEGRDQGQQKIRSSSSAYALPKQGSSYSLSSLFKGLNKPGGLHSLSDALSDTSIKSLAPDLRRPKAEYQDYSGDWSIEDTVRRMKKGKVSLERFRSLKDKLQLLDEAVRLHDGNVITMVLIFLKRTLGTEILFRELEVRQVALQHFIHFLRETEDQKLLQALFRFLDRVEDLALSIYREHLNIPNAEERRDFLKAKCIGLPYSADDAVHVQDHYTLLERQIIIEANDKHVEASGQEEIFRKHPRKASILFMPLVTTLFYSCIYHYTEGEGTFSSPTNLKKIFKIPEKQYVLTALAARAKLRAWHDVDALFTTKNWLGYTKKKAPIGFHRVVEILHKNSAPVQVLQDYIRLVDDVDLKLNLAIKYKCHSVVIDTYKDLKDRHQLMVYRCKLDRNSPEEEKIDHILSNSQIRWKN
ncbi:spermatogenesis-defective protein 39 homolog [Rhinatrema bivittatum]|uniref:spermatogenesis-defective protein 39 homolog n=1 Tax=Rhinatrema bivittatum TaxID=194408 RepID=UPI001128B1DB|nr:spermatogenesis-defective protein 39 homolog [Rhinatrema bivittatum]XP_029453522.1 spermatogenesis-defective protein 39 homolog [Rhinatrema bivittatum]